MLYQLANGTTVSIVCGIPAISSTVVQMLRYLNWLDTPPISIEIVIDAPTGFALHVLEKAGRVSKHLIVVSWSPCAEYWEDIWDLHPHGLLIGKNLDTDLSTALVQVGHGLRYRATPDAHTPLTQSERRIFSLLARGCSNEQIAEQLSLQQQTVKNKMTNIYEKLTVRDRNEALLHYWGIEYSSEGINI